MNIDSDLNLVFPITWNGSEPVIRAYHSPLGRAAFEASYRLLAVVKDVLCPKGEWSQSSPMIATLALRDAGRDEAIQRGLPDGLNEAELEQRMKDGGTAAPLLAEIKRLTTVLVPSATGYEVLPIDVALARKLLTDDDWTDAEAALVFFTCALLMTQRARRAIVAPFFASVLRGSITSSSPTAFAGSLATSIEPATSATPDPSSVPS